MKTDTILILLISLVLMIYPVGAVDNLFYSPTCINPSFDSGYLFTVTENSASIGNVTSASLTAGYLSPSTVRVNHGINLLCAVSDPTSSGSIGGIHRIFGRSEDGSVWYTDIPSDNYSLGFYSLLFQNPTFKIGSLGSYTNNMKLAIDSNGNVFTGDGDRIVKYIKSLDYSEQVFYTLVSGVDYTPGNQPTLSAYILDINIDSSDTLHVLVGSTSSGGSATRTGYLSKTTISSSGVRLNSSLSLQSDSGASTGLAGFDTGGMIIDATNPTQNYTYSALKLFGGVPLLYHNSSNGSTQISTMSGITSRITDIAYRNFQVYVAIQDQNLIRSYVTNYQGFTEAGVPTTGAAELTYTTSDISSVYASYYNNSDVLINYNINVDVQLLQSATQIGQGYKWKIDLVDPSGLVVASSFTGFCDPSAFGFECTTSGTKTFNHPANNWTNGTWTANLYEYTMDDAGLAYLNTAAYSISNLSTSGSGGTSNAPTTEPGNPVNSNEVVNLLQNNSFWALVLIVGIMLGVSVQTSKNGANPMIPSIMAGFAALAVTTLMNWIPSWLMFSVILVTITAMAWILSKTSNTGGGGQ